MWVCQPSPKARSAANTGASSQERFQPSGGHTPGLASTGLRRFQDYPWRGMG